MTMNSKHLLFAVLLGITPVMQGMSRYNVFSMGASPYASTPIGLNKPVVTSGLATPNIAHTSTKAYQVPYLKLIAAAIGCSLSLYTVLKKNIHSKLEDLIKSRVKNSISSSLNSLIRSGLESISFRFPDLSTSADLPADLPAGSAPHNYGAEKLATSAMLMPTSLESQPARRSPLEYRSQMPPIHTSALDIHQEHSSVALIQPQPALSVSFEPAERIDLSHGMNANQYLNHITSQVLQYPPESAIHSYAQSMIDAASGFIEPYPSNNAYYRPYPELERYAQSAESIKRNINTRAKEIYRRLLDKRLKPT